MKILEEIRDFLLSENFDLSKSFADGRINASINEDEVLKVIKNKFPIEIPRSRHWFDFSIEKDGKFFPVNIKITDTTHADNLNCKIGVYYALTGQIPDFPNETSWNNYFEKLKENIKENDLDYYFLVINKQNHKDIFLSSLKKLNSLQANGNNLPFQCKWDTNKKLVDRNFDEAKDFLLSNFGKSIKLRAEIYFIFKKLFGKYV